LNNASCNLINSINPKDKIYLTNSFEGIKKDLSNIDLESYDYILMFGINKNLKDKLMIEVKSVSNKVYNNTNINYNKLKEYIKENGINVDVNYNPTQYLCNFAYYGVLSRNSNAVFIHIPGLSKITDFEKLVKLFNEEIFDYLDK
jgi:pyrrolidone-carboxylate peptidase